MPLMLRDTFKAVIDLSGPSPKLIVTGQLQVSTTGWTASLTKTVPQGPDLMTCLLQLHAMPPQGVPDNAVQAIPLSYEDAAMMINPTQVIVSTDYGESLTINVGLIG
jgi:hypothetical protein